MPGSDQRSSQREESPPARSAYANLLPGHVTRACQHRGEAPFVYIVERDGELDVYASLRDAEEACSFLTDERGQPLTYQEQAVFQPSSKDPSTRDWLTELRAQETGRGCG